MVVGQYIAVVMVVQWRIMKVAVARDELVMELVVDWWWGWVRVRDDAGGGIFIGVINGVEGSRGARHARTAPRVANSRKTRGRHLRMSEVLRSRITWLLLLVVMELVMELVMDRWWGWVRVVEGTIYMKGLSRDSERGGGVEGEHKAPADPAWCGELRSSRQTCGRHLRMSKVLRSRIAGHYITKFFRTDLVLALHV